MVRAAVMHAPDTPLEVVEIDLAEPAGDQVRVRLAVSGVCHSDLSARAGKMAWRPPMVLGHEGTGVVTAVGPDVTRVEPGDHVIVAWNQPCRRCAFCRRGEPYLCERATADVFDRPYATLEGQRLQPFLGAGTFAEETLVLDRAVVPIDRETPLERAALVGCAVTTGVGAVRNTARVHPGASVAVIGCGTVGLAIVQGARLAGASSIVAVDVKPDKLELALDMGATTTVDATAVDVLDAVRAATEGGADFAFEALGRPATIRQAYRAARRGGTVVIVGVGGADDIVEFSAMELFWTARSLVGCVYGSADPDVDFPRILSLTASGELELDRLITGRVGLDDVNAALDRLGEGDGLRSVVTFGDAPTSGS